jgi:[NiFe] hydrogenase assembly HybE family chaperone
MNTTASIPVQTEALVQRTRELTALFRDIARTRMADLPVMHSGLHVEAVGFEPYEGSAMGILITPWFMNLVRFPLLREDLTSGVGCKQLHSLGEQSFEFIGAHEPGFGSYEACSLFSPMFDFENHDAAKATAIAALIALRPAQPPTVAAPALPEAAAERPARRAFLFGRVGATEARK